MNDKTKRASKHGATNGDAAAESAKSFEASIQRLGEIVEALEAGALPLEESLKLFEEGVRLARGSQKVLDDAEQRVEQLLGIDDQGKALSQPLGDDSDDS